MPQFKSKRRARPSCRFTTGQFGLVRDRRHVQLPRIGVVRTAESTRKLARKIEAGQARIRSATLSFQRGRWHVSLSVELPDRRACGLVLDRNENAARNLAALAADTGESRREQPDGSDVRPVVLARPAVAPPREDRASGQRHRREAVAR